MTIVYRLFFTQIHLLVFLSNNLSTVVPGAGREGGKGGGIMLIPLICYGCELRGHTFASQFECHTVITHKNSPTFKPYHFYPYYTLQIKYIQHISLPSEKLQITSSEPISNQILQKNKPIFMNQFLSNISYF